ncbi:MAG TPA: ABC transporter permease [Candidatus Nitrosotenuis sp.]|jgi:simple sugar transport system permease protein|nr:ABC transporter permease [Candidatus Nitrosotenuis sp.]
MDTDVLLGLLRSTIIVAIPLALAALGGVLSERSGVVNIALEGQILAGAFFAVVGNYYVSQAAGPWAGLLGPLAGLFLAMAAGALLSLILGVMAIRFKADQIVTGVALNMLALGLTQFLLQLFFGNSANSEQVSHRLPWWVFALGALGLTLGLHFLLYRTPLGLRIRAVGEHPRAADTLGVNVYRTRYLCVLLAGVLAALGGAFLSTGQLASFSRGMSAGKGFIALAAVIFGRWTPYGACGAALFFGFASALQYNLQTEYIPSQFINALPYLLTMIALAGFIGRSRPPAADGIPYDPGQGR